MRDALRSACHAR